VKASPRFSVRFDEEAFTEDLVHATEAGRAVASSERAWLENRGSVRRSCRRASPRLATARGCRFKTGGRWTFGSRWNICSVSSEA